MALTMKQVMFCTVGFCLVLAASVNGQKNALGGFGYPDDYEQECAPVGRCRLPCRLGKEITGCALCVCPPACKPCISGCYYPSRPDQCPQCAYEFYCELGPNSIYPGIGYHRPLVGFGR